MYLSPSRSTGRGGAGNVGFAEGNQGHTHIPLGPGRSMGRGGAGNMGFGGVDGGGVPEGIAERDEDEDEDKRRKTNAVQKGEGGIGIQLTDRGGAPNLSASPSPVIDRVASESQRRESIGRGGAGNVNLVRNLSS
ncbi:hypothetical protein C0993_005693 [Termitomyces sp. T159_Od127]|nr:hypothetical protein C0993_005693 [Termitomyces sp. T159_Od127]